MNRKTVLAISVGIGLVSLFAGDEFARAAPDDDSLRPNIVQIMGDDLGFSDVGCYGGEINTPNIDSLAERGLRFTQFYNCARCNPTRESLLTGLYPQQADGVHSVTLAEVLRSAGYRTLMTGNWSAAAIRLSSRTGRCSTLRWTAARRTTWPRNIRSESGRRPRSGSSGPSEPAGCRGDSLASKTQRAA